MESLSLFHMSYNVFAVPEPRSGWAEAPWCRSWRHGVRGYLARGGMVHSFHRRMLYR